MKKHIPVALVAVLLICQLEASASSSDEIEGAIDKAKILPAGVFVSVTLDNAKAAVSTYRTAKATEKDCKIDAVMIAKTTMDASRGEIKSVTVYFYNRKDLSTYDTVSLSAGDIKAFSSGELNKEQFLLSVKVDHHEAEAATRISSLIEASAQQLARRPAQAKFDAEGNVQINMQMEPWVPSRDIQFEAVRLAERILESNPSEKVKKITITINDPSGQIEDRNMTIKGDDIPSLDEPVIKALAAITIDKAAATKVVPGPAADSRRDLAHRIAVLKAKTSSTEALEKALAQLEKAVGTESESQLQAKIDSLSKDVTALETTTRTATEITVTARPANTSDITPRELQALIDKAGILTPGTTTSPAMKDNNEAVVAVYKNQLANQTDCKIDAILIAKTLMEWVPKVTVYFYGRNDLSSYDAITLSAGDIKAFGSGKMSKSDFLASLVLEKRRTEDSDRVATLIQSSKARSHQRALVELKGDIANIRAEMASWVADDDARYQALRIAEKVIEGTPANLIRTINITFYDPTEEAGTRSITITPATLTQTVEPAINQALASISIGTGGGAGAGTITVVDGALKDERIKLVTRIEALKAENVGVQSFINFFNMIEQSTVKGDQKGASSLIEKLSLALDQQEKTIKELKEKPVPSTKTVATSSGPPAPIVGAPFENHFVLGRPDIMVGRIKSDPDGYIAYLQQVVPNAASNPRFWHALRFFAQVLRQDGQLEKAAMFDRRVYQANRQHPEFK